MNNKQIELNRIIDNVISCCDMSCVAGNMLNKDDVLGPNRSENVIMTRCILVHEILNAGYSINTVSAILNRTIPAIRHLIKLGDNYRKTSRAYRIAEAQAILLDKDISCNDANN